MSEAVDDSETTDAQIAIFRSQGADRIDPVHFRYIEALATRLLAHQGEVRRILDGKLAQALTAYGEHVVRMQTGSNAVATRQENTDRSTSLADLTRHLTQHARDDVDEKPDVDIAARPELRAIQQYRNIWSKLSVDQQVTKAIKQGPKNAGPLNSHMLVLRSLALMRDISPDYLNRFISYLDTLLCLDQADRKNKPAVKKPLKTKMTKR
jgi:Protein of unknown function (DUF2894)